MVKTISSSKIVYHDADGEKRKKKMDRGMNLRPVTMDFLFQAGVGCIGFYAKYSPFGLFEKDSARSQEATDPEHTINYLGSHSKLIQGI